MLIKNYKINSKILTLTETINKKIENLNYQLLAATRATSEYCLALTLVKKKKVHPILMGLFFLSYVGCN